MEAPGWTGAQEFDTIWEDTFDTAGNDRKGWVKPVPSEKRSIKQGFEAFPSGQTLKEYVRQVQPMEGFFDVAMHGGQDGVGFGTDKLSMNARELANVILHDPTYHGQCIRLLSCDTGRTFTNGDYCFAEELANALGVTVIAPNELLYFNPDGTMRIGQFGEGKMEEFSPNQRRRIK